MKKYAHHLFAIFSVVFLGLNYSISIGQIDTLRENSSETPAFEEAIEDLIQNIDSEDQVDFSYLTDQLQVYLDKPLNLNAATRDELLFLPGMDELKVSQLIHHREQYGKLVSVYELQAIRGFSLGQIRQMLPFVSVREYGSKNLEVSKKHPAGPSLSEIKRNLRFEFIQRAVWTLEEQKGYTAPDSSFRDIRDETGSVIGTDTSLSTRYLGSPYRVYSRLQVRYTPYISMALVGEKDAGEVFEWDPQNNKLGYDFLSGHLAVQNFGNLKSLVVGDYTLQFGQGLVLSRGLGFGKGAQVIKSVKASSKGVNPYRSVNENQFMRGLSSTVAWGDFYATGFYSNRFVDGNIQSRDTLSEEGLIASSLQTSGFHRTPSEIENRKAIQEQITGGRLEFKRNGLRLGLTHYQQSFDSEISPAVRPYNTFAFRGSSNTLTGLDVDWVYRNFNFFGEVARSKSGGMGWVAGFMTSLSPHVDLSVLGRKFDKDFHSNKAYVFAERPTAAQNEAGIYTGLRVMISEKWSFNSYFDQFYFPTSKFRAYLPSRGWEYLGQLEYKPKRGTVAYVRFRSDNQEQNVSNQEAESQLNYLVPFRRNQLRFHFQTQIHRNISYKSRLEFSRVQENGSFRGKGILFYQDLVWKFGFNWKLTGRYALFDIPLSDARIYAYENDVLGFFSIPAYRGTGSRYYLILNTKLSSAMVNFGYVQHAVSFLTHARSAQAWKLYREIPERN